MPLRRWATNVEDARTVEQYNGNAIHGELIVEMSGTPAFYVGGSDGNLIKLLSGAGGNSVSAVNFNADAIVVGNLTVNGTTTTLNSTTLDVADKNITIAKGSANATTANGAGITVDGAAASLIYNSISNSWMFDRKLEAPTLVGNLAASNVIGVVSNASYATLSHNANVANIATVANSVAGANVTGVVANANYATNSNNALYLGGIVSSSYLLKTGNAAQLTAIPGSNVTGTVANATYAISAGSATTAATATVANSVDGANVSGTVANATYALTAGSVSGTVANATYAVTAGSLLNPGAVTFSGNVSGPNGVFSGTVSAVYLSYNQLHEIAQTLTNSISTVGYSINSGQTFIHTSPVGNWTINLIGSSTSSTKINYFKTIIHQGSTAYVPTAVNISGLPVTIKWKNSSAFAGNANKVDVINWTLYGSFGSFTLIADPSTYG